MLQVCGLWLREDKNGDMYLAGDINSKIRVSILKNTFKSEDRHPDYYLNFSNNERKTL